MFWMNIYYIDFFARLYVYKYTYLHNMYTAVGYECYGCNKDEWNPVTKTLWRVTLSDCKDDSQPASQPVN